MANPSPSSSRGYNPFHIPDKLILSHEDVTTLGLRILAERDVLGVDVNALGHGQPVNAPNHLGNAANGPHEPAAANGNATDRSAAGSAPGGTGSQAGSGSAVARQRGSGSAARGSRSHN